jgi:signal peptidase I
VSEKHTRFIREVVETIALTLLILLVISFAMQSFRTDGESMSPSFQNGEYVLVDKVLYLFRQPQRGDIIVFHYPLDPHEVFIKRIVGVPGDAIRTTITTVTVDGQLIHEPYISMSLNYANQTWKLGPNQFFVMGDNRGNSLDSRIWGPLDRSYIIGEVAASYWPVGYIGLVNTYPSVFAAIHPSNAHK